MDITFVQTSDPIFYYQMLHETSRTVRQYCIRNGLKYESFVGIKRGVMPWNAAYNRAYLLKEMVDRNVTGWVFYMDADAYIGDMDFDVREYLRDKGSFGGIFAGFVDLKRPYDVNSGGFAINLSNVHGRQLIHDYWQAVESIPESEYRRAVVWSREIPDDQEMLFQLLSDYCQNRGIGEEFLFEQSNEGFTNHGPFIRQSLRTMSPDFPSRMAAIKAEIDGIMLGRRDARGDAGPGYYLRADHPRIQTANGVRVDGTIRPDGTGGLVSFGPYIPLRAGNYFVRIFGAADAARGGHPIALESDMASDEGQTVWASAVTTLDTPRKGLLVEHRLHLPRDAAQFEVRTYADAHQDIGIHAIQIQWTDQWVAEL